MNLKKILCASLSSAMILMSPGLGVWQALAEQVGAESNGSAERLSSENLGITAGDSVGSAADIPIETPAEILGTGAFELPSVEASDRPSRDEDAEASESGKPRDPEAQASKAPSAAEHQAGTGAMSQASTSSQSDQTPKPKALEEAKSWLGNPPAALNEALLVAAHQGDLAKIKALIEQGADPNARDSAGQMTTALMRAASSHHPEAVAFLLDNGADVNGKDNFGTTVLMRAAAAHDLETAKLLVERGADIQARTENGWTASRYDQHYNLAPHHVANYLDQLVKDKQAALNSDLQTAAAGDHWGYGAEINARMEALIQKGADVNSASHPSGRTVLMYAAVGNHPEVVDFLLKKGAKADARNSHGETALFVAVNERGYQEYAAIAELLLENGADVNAEASDGRTTLIAAAQNGRPEVVGTLIEYGAKKRFKAFLSAVVSFHWTTAKVIAQASLKRLARSLFRSQRSLNEDLIAAASKNNWTEVKNLITRGADVNARIYGGLGETVLMHSAMAAPLDVVQWLIERGADAAATDNAGLTALDYLRFFPKRGGFERYESSPYDNLPLIDGTRPAPDGPVARSLEQAAAAQDLKRRNAPKRPTEEQKALDGALLSAAASGGSADINNAIDRGADVNAKNIINGLTPLSLAAGTRFGDPLMRVRVLVAHGADLNFKDHFDMTALDYAKSAGFEPTARFLEQAARQQIKPTK